LLSVVGAFTSVCRLQTKNNSEHARYYLKGRKKMDEERTPCDRLARNEIGVLTGNKGRLIAWSNP